MSSWKKRLCLERNEKYYHQQQQHQQEFVQIQRKSPLLNNGKMVTARQLLSDEKVLQQNENQKREEDFCGAMSRSRGSGDFTFCEDHRRLTQMPSKKKKRVDAAVLEDDLPGSCSRVSSCSLDSILLIDESVQDENLKRNPTSKGYGTAECDLPSTQTEQTYVAVHGNEFPVSPMLEEEVSLLSQKVTIKHEEWHKSPGKENTHQWGGYHSSEYPPLLSDDDDDPVVKEEFDDGLEDTEIVVLEADNRFISLPEESPSIHQSHHRTSHPTDSSLTNSNDHLRCIPDPFYSLQLWIDMSQRRTRCLVAYQD